jgi:hypothetical protein
MCYSYALSNVMCYSYGYVLVKIWKHKDTENEVMSRENILITFKEAQQTEVKRKSDAELRELLCVKYHADYELMWLGFFHTALQLISRTSGSIIDIANPTGDILLTLLSVFFFSKSHTRRNSCSCCYSIVAML